MAVEYFDRVGDLWTEVVPGKWDCRYGVTAPLDWDTSASDGSPWELIVKAFGPMRRREESE